LILFPYGEDLEYTEDKRLKFTLKFFNKTTTTSVQVSFPADDELSRIMDGLLLEPEDEDEKELWTDD
jgi:hypothetical protein